MTVTLVVAVGWRFSNPDRIDAVLRDVDLTGADIRGSRFHRTPMRGVELADVESNGELQNVVVNGVDIAPLVEAQLDLPWDEAPVGGHPEGTSTGHHQSLQPHPPQPVVVIDTPIRQT